MKTLILGLDAFDAVTFEHLSAKGKLPNLTQYVEANGYARFTVTNPPQSEVSWTSIATGLNPGGHGLFDFVDRDPATYALSVSLLPTKRGIGGTQFVPPYTARTIFDHAVEQGFPAMALWWPAMFPARPGSLVHALPGLGTPDIQGRLGVGTLFSTDAELPKGESKTTVVRLERRGRGRYAGLLSGPTRKTRTGSAESVLELQLEVADAKSARLTIDKHRIELIEGEWSAILELSFKMGRFLSVRALTRVILSQIEPEVKLYFVPLQLHPLRSPWPYAGPRSFVKRTWKACGPFLTLGWPQDTTGLEDTCITDDQFLKLCSSIVDTREQVLMHHLDGFREGILASVFDSLDRVQHMYRRDRPDIVENWYIKMDALFGRVRERMDRLGDRKAQIITVSDHGFSDFSYKVHLNRWLVEQGYLTEKEGGEVGSLRGADWSQSRAYAIGLNSLYLNLAGREGQGCVQESQKESLLDRLEDGLLAWRGPDGRPVVQQAYRRENVFSGPYAAYGPDVVVGFAPGYRASAETGLGTWGEGTFEPNTDHWGADHCIDAEAVSGVLFANQDLRGLVAPSYRDIPTLAVGAPLAQDDSVVPPPSSHSDEDEKAVEERLKGLGYL
jgi:predicted AlkP superfamily phosphohydrolase/phosphomutase